MATFVLGWRRLQGQRDLDLRAPDPRAFGGGISSPSIQEISYHSPGRVVSKSWKVKKRCFHFVVLEGDAHIGKVKWVKSGRATKASLLVQEKGRKKKKRKPIREVVVVVPSSWSFLERLEDKREEIQGDALCAFVAHWKFWELVAGKASKNKTVKEELIGAREALSKALKDRGNG